MLISSRLPSPVCSKEVLLSDMKVVYFLKWFKPSFYNSFLEVGVLILEELDYVSVDFDY